MTYETWQTVVLSGGWLLALWLFCLGVWVRKSLVVLEEDVSWQDTHSEMPDYDLVSSLRRLEEDRPALAMRLRFSRWLGFLVVPAAPAILLWPWGKPAGVLGFALVWIAVAFVDSGRGPIANRFRSCPSWAFRFWVRFTEPLIRVGRPLQKLRGPNTDQDDAQGAVFAEFHAGLTPLGSEERKLLRKLLAGTAIQVSDIMTPWSQVETTPFDVGRAGLLDTFRRSAHSRLPIWNPDRVVGIIHVKDVLAAKDEMPLEALMRSVYFVRWDSVIQEVLDSLREAREHLAVVVDRLGRPAGVATIEDILEEIVGELYDEREAPREARP